MAGHQNGTSHQKSYFTGFGTKAIHVGHEPEKWDINQVIPPISLATTYKQDQPGEPNVHEYARGGNPTRDVLQENLASLEDAKYCRTYSSGMSAVSALVNLLNSGDHIVCCDDVYGGVQRYLRKLSVAKHTLELTQVDMTNLDNLKAALKKNTKMVWFESPSNPLLKVVDIKAAVEISKAYNKDIVVVVDNTFMTPYFQRPLSLGADAVLHSITKYINGHADVLMGAVITNDKALDEHLLYMQLTVGAVPSPFDVYLVLRGMKTLHCRMRLHAENALAVANFLEQNPRVKQVFCPELPSHPQHKGGLQESRKFLSSLKVFTLAESLGGFTSLAELPTLMTHRSVPEEDRAKLGINDSLIRLSIGLEDKEDLINDSEGMNTRKSTAPSIGQLAVM
ncbi:cys/Met metabolism PLP-dependent enzyme domain-containing protein [Ditylenchus destructor]|nr:cys/Met metabolism PLP-dependent enzyme domain-containing protein [Ditylenchus destructor]